MSNIFEGKICSFYKSLVEFDESNIKLLHPGKNIPILDILTKQGYTNSKLLNDLRLSGIGSKFYKDNKKKLSAACFSTVQDDLTITRSDKNTLFHTGFITIDIDIEKNPCLSQPGVSDEMRDFIINEVPYIAYMGKSVSNIGLWGLIPIAYKDDHYAHFRAITKYFSERSIYMDVPLSDVSRARFISYDPDAHIELNPKIFTDTIESVEEVFSSRYVRQDVTVDDDRFFLAACAWVEQKHAIKFEPGSIHNYLLRLYCMLRYANVGREIILQWVYKNLITADKITTNCLDEINFNKK